ncbi:MAG: hypothetical protein ACPGED_06515 [Flavobacteriales bacterium]
MKKLISLALFLSLVMSIKAQFGTTTVTYKSIVFEAVVLEMEGPSDFWKESWKGFVGERYQAKTKGYGFLTNKDLLRSEKQVFEGLSSETADLYAQFSDADQEIYVFMRVGQDLPVGSEKYAEIFDKLTTQMEGFQKNTSNAWFTKLKEEQEEVQKDLEKDLKKLNKSIAKAEKKKQKNTKAAEKYAEKQAELLEDNNELQKELEDDKKQRDRLSNELEEALKKKSEANQQIKR